MSATRKLIVTGGRGFVAGSVMAQGKAECEVHAVSRSAPPGDCSGFHWHPLDSLEAGPWERLFRELRPDALIHTAAAADVDYCEANPEPARAVNVGLTRTLAGLCARHGVRLVHCSTDTVFDGEHAPYAEADLPGPINLYAQTKVEAERVVVDSGADSVIARLSLVVGLPLLGPGNSALVRMLHSWREGRPVGGLVGEFRTPIDVVTLGRALLELAAGDHHGLMHLAGNTRLSRHEMVLQIARCFGFPDRLVFAQESLPPSGRAPRPRDVSLVNEKARAALKTPMLDLADGLSLVRRLSPGPLP